MATAHNLKPAIVVSSIPFPQYSSFTSTTPHLSRFFGTDLSKISRPQKLLPSMLLLSRRRLVLPSVSGMWEALTGGSSAREAVMAIRRGMLLFRQGDVLGSLVEFDRAIELDPRQKAHLWQRGLSLYYLDRFEEGAEQFRLDVAQNPNDTEESIWCFLCEAQLYGVDEARRRYLEISICTMLSWTCCSRSLELLRVKYFSLLLEVGRDPRPVMREAYSMFKDGGDPEKLVAAFSGGRENEYFYASLYAGLYYESQDKQDEAKRHIVAACQSPYGLRSDDYMASLAKVHCLCRNWGSA
ncbi:uncharacterized protein [Coffea arabica]|uniref:Uncharacterized protein isoform X2 n=1 Tax=Coffea arabica TaxID=13443 RepID=A0A6P6VXM3_COFAR